MDFIIDARVFSKIDENGDSGSSLKEQLLFNTRHCIKTLVNSGRFNIKILARKGLSLGDLAVLSYLDQKQLQISYSNLKSEINNLSANDKILIIPPTLVFNKGMLDFLVASNDTDNICYYENNEDMMSFNMFNDCSINDLINKWDNKAIGLNATKDNLPLIQINDVNKRVSHVVLNNKILSNHLFSHNGQSRQIAPPSVLFKEIMGIVVNPTSFPLVTLRDKSDNYLSDSILIYSDEKVLPPQYKEMNPGYFVKVDEESGIEENLQVVQQIISGNSENVIVVISNGLSSDFIRKMLGIAHRFASASPFLISSMNNIEKDIELCSRLVSDTMDYSISSSVPEIMFDIYTFSRMLRSERISLLHEMLFEVIDAIWSENNNDIRRAFLEEAVTYIVLNGERFVYGMDIDPQMAKLFINIKKYNCTYSKSKLSVLLDAFLQNKEHLSEDAKLFLGSKFWHAYASFLHASDKGNRKWLDSSLAFMKNVFDFTNAGEIIHFVLYYIKCLSNIDGSQSIAYLEEIELDFWNWLEETDKNEALSDLPIRIASHELKRTTSVKELLLNYEQSFRYIGFYRPYQNMSMFVRYKKWLELYLSQAVHKIKTELLKKITDYCDKECLPYFMVDDGLYAWHKFNGFLNHNIQLRIAMAQKDFIKVTKHFAEVALHDDSFGCMYANETNNSNWFYETRIYDKATYYVEKVDAYYSSLARGVYISICSIDYFKNTSTMSKIKYKIVHGINGLIQYRINDESRKLGWKGRLLAKTISPFSNHSIRRLQRLVQGIGKSGRYACYNYTGDMQVDFVDSSIFTESVKVSFYDIEISVPKSYKVLLNQKYYCCDNSYRHDSKLVKLSLDRINTYKFMDIKPNKVVIRSVENTVSRGFKDRLKQAKLVVNKHAAAGLTKIAGFARSLGIHISPNTRELASFKNRYKGQRCFLIGNGPSLTAEDLDLLQNEKTFACNLIHNIYNQTAWRPSFLCISDSTITRTMSEEIVDHLGSETTMLIREFAYRYMQIKPSHAIKLPYISSDKYKVIGNVLAYHYISRATVMSMMLEIAIYMGFSEIYILGLDGTSASGKGSHFVDHYFNKRMKEYADSVKKRVLKNYNPQERAKHLQERSLYIYQQLRDFAEKKDVSIYNATRGGYVEVFKRKCLDDIIGR